MRKVTLILSTLVFFALAGAASASCISCNDPCTGPSGPNFRCNDDNMGIYGGCNNRPNCKGCIGWIDQACLPSAEADLAPEPLQPLLGVSRVTAVVVRHDPTPVQPAAYQLALAR